MHQAGLFDLQLRHLKIKEHSTILSRLNEIVDWEDFRETLQTIHNKERKSNAGRNPLDVVLMFKILILQSLYNLSDRQMELQILDRLSFMAFLDLKLNDDVPDEKTIWLFRENLTKAGLIKPLFDQFEETLASNGFAAQQGQIIDATIVSAPKQRNTREENQQIKEGDVPEQWDSTPHKKRQKDTEARWTQKRKVSYYGYKNHVNVDVAHKFIREFEVTSASVHDSQVVDQILDCNNSGKDFYADSAYWSQKIFDQLEASNLRNCITEKGVRNAPLNEEQKASNRKKSKIRSRVEHVFGIQSQRAGSLLLRGIGIVRARTKIGLRNLSYNLSRYVLLAGKT